MALSYSKRLGQLEKLNVELAQAPNKPVFSDGYVLSGLLSKFKICFDIALKLMKDIMVEEWAIDDFPKGSPRETISRAFYNGLITDEEIWLRMLRLRNELSHMYDGGLAEQAAHEVMDDYIPALAGFENDMRQLIDSFKGGEDTSASSEDESGLE